MTYTDLRNVLSEVSDQEMSVKELREILFNIEVENDIKGICNDVNDSVLRRKTYKR